MNQKTIKAWAVIDDEHRFPIPNIPRKIDGDILYPSCVFSIKRWAEEVKKKAKEKYPELKFKVVHIEIKILKEK